MTNHILTQTKDRIAIVTLNRPEQKNCVTLAMWQGLADLFGQLSEDSDIRGVILTGSGGNFCTGADISEFGEVRSTAEQITAYSQAVDGASNAIMKTQKPVIAAIQGYCVGGGCGLALACDFRIVSPNATFFIPAAKMSIVYDLRSTQNLLALVGLSNAKRILYAAERLNAEKAQQMGLINRIEAHPLKQSIEFAKEMAKNAPLSIAGTKFILNQLALGTGTLDLAQAKALMLKASESDDYQEGQQAFKARRDPQFKGW